MQEVVIYSRAGCDLCEEALAILRKVQKSLPFVLKEVDILEENGLYENFKDEIPVIYINSRKAFKYRVDERKLIQRLQRGISLIS